MAESSISVSVNVETIYLGGKLGAAALCPEDPIPCVDDLADQILEVLNYFGLGAVMEIGGRAGAYILTLFAVQFSYQFQQWACGSMVTEEQPHAILIPMEYFLMRYGLYRANKVSSPLSRTAPELLYPESMGLKLKPIKTRVSTQR
ncbi:unnamed protein product [Fraxinus pennsylvanica]|uniref:Uncharacterized protein n=1 Tax=Fraxinus pennsylvanica TaxID=56036 RepID=A0AAD1ZAM5_9LAMI|nr:unnamed protein product [Fraxinus pennsylvanica]